MGRSYGDLYSIAPYTSSHPVIIHPIPNPSTYNTTVHVHLRWFICSNLHNSYRLYEPAKALFLGWSQIRSKIAQIEMNWMKFNMQSMISQIKIVRFETIKAILFPSWNPAEKQWIQAGSSKGGPGGKHRAPGLEPGGERPGYDWGTTGVKIAAWPRN